MNVGLSSSKSTLIVGKVRLPVEPQLLHLTDPCRLVPGDSAPTSLFARLKVPGDVAV